MEEVKGDHLDTDVEFGLPAIIFLPVSFFFGGGHSNRTTGLDLLGYMVTITLTILVRFSG